MKNRDKMNEYQNAITFFIKDRCFSFDEANDIFIHKGSLQKLVSKMTIPYANDKGGYSCRNCDIDVFYNDDYCRYCGTSLDWGDND